MIDDEPGLLTLMTFALQHAGFAVTATSQGAKARELIRQREYALVVTDIFLPDVDGIELIALVRRLWPNTKLVAVSAGGTYAASPYALTLAKKMGVQEVLHKPFAADQLVTVVSALLPGSPSASS